MDNNSIDTAIDFPSGEKQPTVYLAGKVTDLPYNEVYSKFMAKQLELEAMGFKVLNPCLVIRQDAPWDRAMRIALGLLLTADFICLLHDWHESEGAKMERSVALKLNIPSIDN